MADEMGLGKTVSASTNYEFVIVWYLILYMTAAMHHTYVDLAASIRRYW